MSIFNKFFIDPYLFNILKLIINSDIYGYKYYSSNIDYVKNPDETGRYILISDKHGSKKKIMFPNRDTYYELKKILPKNDIPDKQMEEVPNFEMEDIITNGKFPLITDEENYSKAIKLLTKIYNNYFIHIKNEALKKLTIYEMTDDIPDETVVDIIKLFYTSSMHSTLVDISFGNDIIRYINGSFITSPEYKSFINETSLYKAKYITYKEQIETDLEIEAENLKKTEKELEIEAEENRLEDLKHGIKPEPLYDTQGTPLEKRIYNYPSPMSKEEYNENRKFKNSKGKLIYLYDEKAQSSEKKIHTYCTNNQACKNGGYNLACYNGKHIKEDDVLIKSRGEDPITSSDDKKKISCRNIDRIDTYLGFDMYDPIGSTDESCINNSKLTDVQKNCYINRSGTECTDEDVYKYATYINKECNPLINKDEKKYTLNLNYNTNFQIVDNDDGSLKAKQTLKYWPGDKACQLWYSDINKDPVTEEEIDLTTDDGAKKWLEYKKKCAFADNRNNDDLRHFIPINCHELCNQDGIIEDQNGNTTDCKMFTGNIKTNIDQDCSNVDPGECGQTFDLTCELFPESVSHLSYDDEYDGKTFERESNYDLHKKDYYKNYKLNDDKNICGEKLFIKVLN